MIDQTKNTAIELGRCIATIAKKNNAMIIGSSDFTHYEENDFAHKQDKALIEPILDMDLETFSINFISSSHKSEKVFSFLSMNSLTFVTTCFVECGILVLTITR